MGAEDRPSRWRKSTKSAADCVELAAMADLVCVRDGKNIEEFLAFERPVWRRFVRDMTEGGWSRG